MKNNIANLILALIMILGLPAFAMKNCPGESIKKDVSFSNLGIKDATVSINRAMVFCPDIDTVDPDLSVASFLANQINSSKLVLPIGKYKFCVQWEDGTEEVDGNTFTIFKHAFTKNISFGENVLEPVTVPISPGGAGGNRGICPPVQADNMGGVIPLRAGMIKPPEDVIVMGSMTTIQCVDPSITKRVEFSNFGIENAVVSVNMATLACPEDNSVDPLLSTASFVTSVNRGALGLPLGVYRFCYDWVSGSEQREGGRFQTFRHLFTNNIGVSANSTNPITIPISPGGAGGRRGPCPEVDAIPTGIGMAMSGMSGMSGMSSSSMSGGGSNRVCNATGSNVLRFDNVGPLDDPFLSSNFLSIVVTGSSNSCVNPTWGVEIEPGETGVIRGLPDGNFSICYDYAFDSQSGQALFKNKSEKNIEAGSTVEVLGMGGKSGFCKSTVFEGSFQGDSSSSSCLLNDKKLKVRVKGLNITGFTENGLEIKGKLATNKGRGKNLVTNGTIIDTNNDNKVVARFLKGREISGNFDESHVNFNSRDMFIDYRETENSNCTGTLFGGRF